MREEEAESGDLLVKWVLVALVFFNLYLAFMVFQTFQASLTNLLEGGMMVVPLDRVWILAVIVAFAVYLMHKVLKISEDGK